MDTATAYMARLRANYEANMAFFAEHLPEFHRQLGAEGTVQIHFEVGGYGEVTILIDGHRHTEAKLIEESRRQLQLFRSRTAYTGVAIHRDMVRDTDKDVQSPTFDWYQENLHQTCKRLVSDVINQSTEGQADEYFHVQPDYGEDVTPITIVVGTGLGWHLPALAACCEMRHMIVIDTDINITKLSLYFVDYVRLFHQLRDRGARFTIYADQDDERLADLVMLAVMEYWPPFMFNGMHLYYGTRDVNVTDRVIKRMTDDFYRQMFFGWGFFDDEMASLRQSLVNYQRRVPLCLGIRERVKDNVTVIVAGSGPSLDGLMDTIRKHRDQVVLISCGTALRSLAKAGIVPDFHIEIERNDVSYHALLGAGEEALDQVRMVGVNVVYPKMFELGRAQYMILKGDDTGSKLLEGFGYPGFMTTPSVVNAGVDFALSFGFRRIVLAGTDCGFVDKERHHAASTIYHEEDSAVHPEVAAAIAQSMADQRYADTELTAEGNFRPQVGSNSTLLICRDALQVQIFKRPDVVFLNPNDGAKIRGAQAVRPEDIEISGNPAHVAAAIRRIESNFSADYPLPLQEIFDGLFAEMKSLHQEISAICGRPMQRRIDVFDAIAEIYLIFKRPEVAESKSRYLLRGTILHVSRMIHDYVSMLKDDTQALRVAQECLGVIPWFIERAADTLNGLDLDNLAPDRFAVSPTLH